MALSAASMKAKVRAAYTARTGLSMPDDPTWGVLIDLCTGIVNEIQANAQVNAHIPVSTTGTGTVIGGMVTIDSAGDTTAIGTIS